MTSSGGSSIDLASPCNSVPSFGVQARDGALRFQRLVRSFTRRPFIRRRRARVGQHRLVPGLRRRGRLTAGRLPAGRSPATRRLHPAEGGRRLLRPRQTSSGEAGSDRAGRRDVAPPAPPGRSADLDLAPCRPRRSEPRARFPAGAVARSRLAIAMTKMASCKKRCHPERSEGSLTGVAKDPSLRLCSGQALHSG